MAQSLFKHLPGIVDQLRGIHFQNGALQRKGLIGSQLQQMNQFQFRKPQVVFCLLHKGPLPGHLSLHLQQGALRKLSPFIQHPGAPQLLSNKPELRLCHFQHIVIIEDLKVSS